MKNINEIPKFFAFLYKYYNIFNFNIYNFIFKFKFDCMRVAVFIKLIRNIRKL